MARGKCALCKKDSVPKKSHIVPKFVSKWLKKTSATGFMRGVKEPKKRLQDLPRLPLLCGDCEQLFSKLESYFASKIFHPILDGKEKEVSYDEDFQRLIVSLNWRTLLTGYSDQIKVHPWIEQHLLTAEECWRKYLLQESPNTEPYEHHCFSVGYIKSEIGVPEKFQWYTLRATDSTLVSNDDQSVVFAFTHFPHFFFASTIFPFTFPSWKATKISSKGKFSIKNLIDDPFFWDFLVSRGKLTVSSLDGSGSEKIAKAIEKEPEKFLKSESFIVMLEESKRQRLKRIEKLPETIKGLIDIIDRSVDNPALNTLQQKWVDYTQHTVANALSRIPLDKAQIIDALLQSTTFMADVNHRITQCEFETQELIVKFMVTLCETKNQQRNFLKQAVDDLKKKKHADDQRIIVVFSFNPWDQEMPYETVYYVD
ncbi:MAG: hypothetical protein ACFFCW_26070 [Candidatus Hodarchaeota archaeon]